MAIPMSLLNSHVDDLKKRFAFLLFLAAFACFAVKRLFCSTVIHKSQPPIKVNLSHPCQKGSEARH